MKNSDVAREMTTIVIEEWMYHPEGLGLRPTSIELVMFSRIRYFGSQQAGLYYESNTACANRLGLSRERVNKAIKSLLQRGYIEEVSAYLPGSNKDCKKYRVPVSVIENAIENTRIALCSRGESKVDDVSVTDRHMSSGYNIGKNASSCDETSHEKNHHVTGGHTSCDGPSHLNKSELEGYKNNESSSFQEEEEAQGTVSLPMQNGFTEEDIEQSFSALCESSIKKIRSGHKDKVRQSYLKAVGEGYGLNQIHEAYDDYVVSVIKRNGRDVLKAAHYTKSLLSWLEDNDGLHLYKPETRTETSPDACASQEAIAQKLALQKEELTRIDPDYEKLCNELAEAGTQMLKASRESGWRNSEEVTEKVETYRKVKEAEELYFEQWLEAQAPA